jgi:hypothetical protein
MYSFRRDVTLALAVLLTAARLSWAANEPMGIVMSARGTVTPTLLEMQEMDVNTAWRLEPDAQVTFLQYSVCKLVTVVGGTLRIGAIGYTTDGKVIEEREGPCPRVYSVNKGGSSAGVLMRGPQHAPPRWPIDFGILLTGARALRVREAVVYVEEPTNPPLQFRLNVKDGRIQQPPARAPLLANKPYSLRLSLEGEAEPIEIRFIGAPAAGSGAFIVLRVE